MSMSKPSILYRLQGSVNNYEWGTKGHDSLVAQLGPNAVGPSFKVEENEPYAELWMGTHPNGPARLFPPNLQLLQDVLKEDPKHHVGEPLLNKFKDIQLPYLFKVLSIARALPLQAHPSKPLAKKLNQKDPKQFVDSNHKPEIAVAISPNGAVEYFPDLPLYARANTHTAAEDVSFTGFVGFQPLPHIAATLSNTPELQDVIGKPDVISKFVQTPTKDGLKAIYCALLERGASDKEHVAAQIKAYLERAEKDKQGDKDEDTTLRLRGFAKLARKVNAEYEGDVGVFATVFFMNFVQLKQGEALFIPADDVHAYLEGDIIECMATSDNVLNAAFPPPKPSAEDDAKPAVDQLEFFERTLTWEAAPPTHWRLPATPFQKHTTMYQPSLEEFVVLHTALDKVDLTETLGRLGPTTGIVLEGKVEVTANGAQGQERSVLEKGAIVFASAGSEVVVRAMEPSSIWWATCLL
ncbi:hypothetical protein EVG20_g7863 [Dentipellis fragilis]|uniref:Mannose-6-phosphate isomerase n=1 Tax=Dentipellis fragilis TaxID=205917 RepID=A0A4Y9YEE0_9AGAM|nr:hypothetical protein EVG20_g7863 [Dentipellis fragilis]